MEFREALLSIANHTRFAEETHKLEVVDAINGALTIPESTDDSDDSDATVLDFSQS